MRGRKTCMGEGTKVGTWNRHYYSVTGAIRAAVRKKS